MKKYLIFAIAVLLASIVGFLIGRYTSNTGRYFFKFDGKYPALFDTKTGDLFYKDDSRKILKVNYKDEIDSSNDKKK